MDSYKQQIDELQLRLESLACELERSPLKPVTVDSFSALLNNHLLQLYSSSNSEEGQARVEIKEYFKRKLQKYFMQEPINRHMIEKPFGYTGDYQLVKMIYEAGREKPFENKFVQLMRMHMLSMPIIRSNIERIDLFKGVIGELIQSRLQVKIASISCGPAIEIFDSLQDLRPGCNVEVCLLCVTDAEMAYVKTKVAEIDNPRCKFHVELLEIRKLIRLKQPAECKGFDLIYSSGLFDYMNDTIARKTITAMNALKSETGKIVVVSASRENLHDTLLYEILGEWVFNHRDRSDIEHNWLGDGGFASVTYQATPAKGYHYFTLN